MMDAWMDLRIMLVGALFVVKHFQCLDLPFSIRGHKNGSKTPGNHTVPAELQVFDVLTPIF
jgi:hypothetical protein